MHIKFQYVYFGFCQLKQSIFSFACLYKILILFADTSTSKLWIIVLTPLCICVRVPWLQSPCLYTPCVERGLCSQIHSLLCHTRHLKKQFMSLYPCAGHGIYSEKYSPLCHTEHLKTMHYTKPDTYIDCM